MGSSRNNKAGKGKSATSKGLDLPTTIQPASNSDSSRPTTTPVNTHGKPTGNLATAMDTVAKTVVPSNASNVHTSPRKPVKRPHEGSVIPNVSRTKASDQVPAVKSGAPSKIEERPVDKPEPSKAKSEKAKDDESDEMVNGIGAAHQSSTNLLNRGLNHLGVILASAATTASNTASEASKKTTLNTTGMEDTATPANKAIASIEDPTSNFDGPSATAANPNTTSTSPKSLFTAPNSSQTKSLPLFGISGTLGRPEQKSDTSGAFTLSIDFSTAPTPNPLITSPFGVLKSPETPSTPNTALASQFSVLCTLDTVPTSNPTAESPFGGLKMADTTPKTNLTTESPFGLRKMADTTPNSNLIPCNPLSSSKALSKTPVPNPATTSPFGLFKLPHTASSPNPEMTSPFGVSETAPTHNPAKTSPFGIFKRLEAAPTHTTVITNPFGAPTMDETAPKPNLATNSPFGVFNISDTAPTPNSATNSQFGVFNRPDTTCTPPNSATNSPFGGFKMTDTARPPNLAPKSLFSTVKAPAENIFSKSNFPTSDTGDSQAKGSQAKGFFGNLYDQARQSKSISFGFGPTGSSPSLLAPFKLTRFDPGNGDSLKTCNPAIFNESKLPPIEPGFSPEMAIAEELSNTDQPMVPFDHYQPKDGSLSSFFKSLQTDNALPSANIMGNSTTQQIANKFCDSPFNQTTNEMQFQKRQDFIPYQKHAIQEPRSSKTWLLEQNEILSRNLAISIQNLGRYEAQLQYFSKRCNDLNKICKERREEIAKLYEELDKVNAVCEAEKEKAKQALELFKREKYTSLSGYAIYVHILICILVSLLAMNLHKWIF